MSRDVKRRTINENKRKLVDADITVRNNCLSLVILKSERNGGSFYELNPNEVEDISFEDMQSITKKQRGLFSDFSVVIDDVYCPEDSSIGVEEVEEVLGLGRIKKGMNETPNDLLFDDLLSNDCSFEEFTEEVDTMKREVIDRLIERAVFLYIEKEFSNSFKMSYLEKKIGRSNVFEDIDRSQKPIKADIDMLDML